jgi:hypothetical protein
MRNDQKRPTTPIALRPMRPTEILGSAFGLYRRHWRTLVPIVALGAPIAVSMPSTTALPTPGGEYQVVVHHRVVATAGSWADTTVVVLATLLGLLALAVVAGAVTRAAVAAGGGEDLGVWRSYRFAVGRVWPLLAVLVLSWLLIAIGLVLLVVPGVVVGVQLAVAVPALVVEGIGPGKALARSERLVRGRWWHTFGTLLLTWLVLGLAVNLADRADGGVGIGWLEQSVVQGLAITLVTPFAVVVLALLYLDLRAREAPPDTG